MEGNFNSLPFPIQLMQLRQMQAQEAARKQAGQVLYDQFPAAPLPQPQPAGIPQPPPGTPQGGPQAPPPGMQSQPNPMAAGGASVMAPPAPGGGMPPPPMAMQRPQAAPGAAPMGPPQIPPFRPMPSTPPQGAPGQVPPPPNAAAAPADINQQEHPLDLKNIIGGLRKSGVQPERVMDMLDALSPAMNAQNKQELEYFKANNAALKAANDAYAKTLQAMAATTRAGTGVKAEERRKEQGDERNNIAREKLARQAGGAGNIKKWEFDPKDTTKVIGGWTASGKHIQLDEPGEAVPGKPGGSQKDAVRTSIVKAGVTNSLARLNEIDKLGDVSTSSFFGQHGDNPLTRAAYGAGKSTQTKAQQDADAKWASMIDEAIPVFTGGLRGSDAFRRFLIEQAPGPGDKPETIKEKKRLFRQNIEGTSKAFFNKFSSDPSFWGPGVTPDQANAGGGAGGQSGLPEGSKVIGKSPDGKDVYQSPDGKKWTAD